MEYAGSYALYNYRLADPALGMDAPGNLRLIRAFEKGLDPASSEAGFVLVHVDMVRHSGKLVEGVARSFGAFEMVGGDDASSAVIAHARLRSRVELNAGLAAVVDALRDIDTAMETMWARSRPSGYAGFRTFIFGIAAQSMFPDGVLYEGLEGGEDVREEEEMFPDGNDDAGAGRETTVVVRKGKKLSFRGESGANDSMVPLLDNFLQITMPDTPLTRILQDFRDYRPSNHRAFLAYAARQSLALDLRNEALGLSSNDEKETTNGQKEEDEDGTLAAAAASRLLWLRLLDGVRRFRWRHWCFAREYVLNPRPGTPAARHPTATGGSPIVQWLPNQLRAVVAEMERACADVEAAAAVAAGGIEGGVVCGFGGPEAQAQVADIMAAARRQDERLEKEVRRYCKERGIEGGQ